MTRTPIEAAGIDAFRRALIQADPRLSRFNPLPRILAYDDFDEGANGWCELCGNHDGNLDTIKPLTADLRPPQLSNCSFFDIGTHGSVDGTYALKLATRPKPGHTAVAIKRLTMAALGLIQFETYFTYKAEAATPGLPSWEDAGGRRGWDGNVHPTEAQFGDITISNDLCAATDRRRYHCALRYVNTDRHGNLVQKWMYKTTVHPTTRMQMAGESDRPVDLHTVSPDDWAEVPDGHQRLCFNEVPTKINWHYLRWTIDTRVKRNVELQVNDKVMDLREIEVPRYEHTYEALDGLLNVFVDVRTHTAARNFLFVDSAVISADW